MAMWLGRLALLQILAWVRRFLGCNRNKKSVVVDLKCEAGMEALWKLIESADLFLHNVRPQKIEKTWPVFSGSNEKKAPILFTLHCMVI